MLNAAITQCRHCPRLVAHRERIARVKRRAYLGEEYWGRPVPGNGDPQARVLLVGLAPGAHGSNRTGRMFTGDGSAEFLIPALHRAGFANQNASTRVNDGLALRDLYIAAAAHCAPPGNRPTPLEIRRCRPYLIEHLAVLSRLQIIVCLGAVAWDGFLGAAGGYGLAMPKPRPKFRHMGRIELGRWAVIATYHPSRQNTQTGRLTAAMLDEVFQLVRSELAIYGPRSS
ncbi:MAG: uracil-DNA glycosylase [Anaerolineales bacterium]